MVGDGTITKGCTSKWGYLPRKETEAGVRAVIVAVKLGNSSGAKDSRKMDEWRGSTDRRESPIKKWQFLPKLIGCGVSLSSW